MCVNFAHKFSYFHCVKILLLKHSIDDVILGLREEHENLAIDGGTDNFGYFKCINVLDNDIQARVHIIAIFMSLHFKRIILSSKQVIFLLTNFSEAFMYFNELLPNI